MNRPTVRIALDCACGDTARGRVSPPAAYVDIKAAFAAVHSGEACRVTDRTEHESANTATIEEAVS